jgi:hypothetical protein
MSTITVFGKSFLYSPECRAEQGIGEDRDKVYLFSPVIGSGNQLIPILFWTDRTLASVSSEITAQAALLGGGASRG